MTIDLPVDMMPAIMSGIECGFSGVYASLAFMATRERKWCHAAIYGAAALLASGLAACGFLAAR